MTVAGIKQASGIYTNNVTSIVKETDEQILARITERFEILEDLIDDCIKGTSRSMIISGPPGLGKSFTVRKKLTAYDPNMLNHTHISGYVRTTGLVKTLYDFRNLGQVVVLDDCDHVFFDENSLNILKAVCDTIEQRKVYWLSEGKLFSDLTGELLPKSFEFNASIIFITNHDFDYAIQRGHRFKVHFEALISRSHYVDTSLKTKRDHLLRIKQAIGQGLLKGMDVEQQIEVYKFIYENYLSLRELSLRMALKIASIRKGNSPKWERIAKITCCKNI